MQKLFEVITLKQFKAIGLLEALSYILLLFVAMPLKYIWQKPEMVQIVGMAHGVLFMAYVYGAFIMKPKLNWNTKTFLIVLFCSILPFGPFYVDKKYLHEF